MESAVLILSLTAGDLDYESGEKRHSDSSVPVRRVRRGNARELLGALAVPLYRHYSERANRTEAMTELLNIAACQERIYQKLNAYDATDGCGLNGTSKRTTSNGLYVIEMTTQNNDQNFVLTATSQALCVNLTPYTLYLG